MKATQQQINHLGDQFNDMLYELSLTEFHKLEMSYDRNPIKVAWNMYWEAVKREPELWRQETKDWNDSHIQTLIKHAMKQTMLPADKIK